MRIGFSIAATWWNSLLIFVGHRTHALLSLRYMSWLNGDWRIVIWDQMSHVLESPLSHPPPQKILVHEDISTRKWNSELPEHPANLTIEGGHLALDSIIQWNAIYSCSECRVHQHTHVYQGIRREAASKLRALARRFNCFLKWTATGKGQQEKQQQGRSGTLPLEITQGWGFLSISM